MAKILFARVEVWILLVLVLAGFLGLILFGAIVLDEERGKGRFGAVGTAALPWPTFPGR